jgi:hypothetical protein
MKIDFVFPGIENALHAKKYAKGEGACYHRRFNTLAVFALPWRLCVVVFSGVHKKNHPDCSGWLLRLG